MDNTCLFHATLHITKSDIHTAMVELPAAAAYKACLHLQKKDSIIQLQQEIWKVTADSGQQHETELKSLLQHSIHSMDQWKERAQLQQSVSATKATLIQGLETAIKACNYLS